MVLESQDRNFCLLVDDLLGKQEVVIKSLGEAFKDIPGLSGCAVLGDDTGERSLRRNGVAC